MTFGKQAGGRWVTADDFVSAPTYELRADVPGDRLREVDGWRWYDTSIDDTEQPSQPAIDAADASSIDTEAPDWSDRMSDQLDRSRALRAAILTACTITTEPDATQDVAADG